MTDRTLPEVLGDGSPYGRADSDGWPSMRLPERRGVLDAVVTMVTTLGGACSTAYLVAAELAFGLESPAERPRRWPR